MLHIAYSRPLCLYIVTNIKGFPASEDQAGVDDQGKVSIYLTSECQLVGSYTPFSGPEE